MNKNRFLQGRGKLVILVLLALLLEEVRWQEPNLGSPSVFSFYPMCIFPFLARRRLLYL